MPYRALFICSKIIWNRWGTKNSSTESLRKLQRIPPKSLTNQLFQGAEKSPRRLTMAKTAEASHRARFYEILDLILSEIGKRFDQPTMKFLSNLEEILFKSVNVVPIDPENVRKLVGKCPEIDSESLSSQLGVLPELLKINNAKKTPKISTFQMLLANEFPEMKVIFCQVVNRLKIYLTIPMTNATCFSKLSLTPSPEINHKIYYDWKTAKSFAVFEHTQ